MKQAKITYEALGDTLLIHMPKELDHHNCRDLKRDTDLMLDENYINRIIFDFGKTEFMDSSGIGVLLNRYKQMAASRGTVTYYGAGPRVVRILEMGGLVRLIRGLDVGDPELVGGGRGEVVGAVLPQAGVLRRLG